MEGLEQNQKLM